MKSFICVPLFALLAIPAFTYSTSSIAASKTSPHDEMIEAEEYETEVFDEPMSPEEADEMRKEEKQKMEERNFEEEAINYKDRTRTDRERKALNTGSDASDDQ